MLRRVTVVPLLLFVLLPAIAAAQLPREITVEWIYSGGPSLVAALPECEWLSDGTLYVDERTDDGAWQRLDPATLEFAPAFPADEALESLGQVLGRRPRLIPWPESFDPSGQRALYPVSGELLVFHLPSASFSRVTRTPVAEKSARFSPDGQKLAFIRENDLWVHDFTTGATSRLTHDGSETILNGTLPWVYWEEVFGRQDLGYWWAPDSSAIAFLRSDESLVTEMTYVDVDPALPDLIKQRYPKAGTANPVVRLGIVELGASEGEGAPAITWVTLGDNTAEYIVRAKWLPSSDRIAAQTLDRAQRRLDLWFADRKSGSSQHILTEEDPAWINLHDDLVFLEKREEFLWVSEESGHAHIYRHGMDGKRLGPVTSGPWSVHSSSPIFWMRQAILTVDESGADTWVYFGSLEADPLDNQIYRIKLDGTGQERITPEAGTHAVRFGPNARFFLDEHSTAAQPPALSLRKASGEVAKVLAPARRSMVEELGIVVPELTSIPARDGVAMPAAIWKPKDFDASRKYPVILSVYGGPSSRGVTNSWDDDNYFHQILLREGFVVAKVDNRAATGVDAKSERTLHLEMIGDVELRDMVDAAQWFKKQEWIDPARVGIWGWSNGGSMTLLAMTGSEEFKAGIAVAPVTDWTLYDTIWAEKAMKTPEANPRGYERTNLVAQAGNLHGELLLVHGTYDDNVHIQNSWRFVNGLVRAHKLFELMVYPMRQHGIADRDARIHLFLTMVDFWKRKL